MIYTKRLTRSNTTSITKRREDGEFYNIIKTTYQNIESCVRIGSNMTEWISCKLGVRLGNNISHILFASLINNLAIKIKSFSKGIRIQQGSGSNRDYRHIMDIALIAETESVMQTVSDLVTDRCNNWKNQININKSKGMLFRKRKIKQSMVIFRLENDALDYVPSCKYSKCITFGCEFF